MIRKAFAPIAYFAAFMLVYGIFWEVTSWLVVNPKTINEINLLNKASPTWGEHNVIFFLSFMSASFLAAFISGAIWRAKTKINIGLVCSLVFSGAVVAFYLKYLDYPGYFIVPLNTFPITSSIALFSSCIVSYAGFNEGTIVQEGFDDETILGIQKYHWLWILFPLTIGPTYIWGLFFVTALFKAIPLYADDGMFLLYFLALIPLLIWGSVPVIIYKTLSFEMYEDKSSGVRFLIVIGTYIAGCGLAVLSQIPCYWLINKFI